MSWQIILARELNRDFGEPFLPKGFVEAEVRYEGTVLRIRIGDRDVEIDSSGKVIAGGTAVGPGSRWEIKRKGEGG